MNLLFKLSESRGKEASGIAAITDESITTFKKAISSSKLTKTEEYKTIFKTITDRPTNNNVKTGFAFIGHSRLVTNGQSELNSNNQPVVKDGAVAIHNGIIVNDKELWSSFPELTKKFDVDTEVFLALLQMFRKTKPLLESVKNTFLRIEGSASVAVLFNDLNHILFATNTGSLYTCKSINETMLLFASEKYILKQLIKKSHLEKIFYENSIKQIKPRHGYLVNIYSLKETKFTLDSYTEDTSLIAQTINPKRKIIELNPKDTTTTTSNNDEHILSEDTKQAMIKMWQQLYSENANLKRCTRCLLPETMPFIHFNEHGVCNYCITYDRRNISLKGEKVLREFVQKYRTNNGEPDCIIGFSGGRDSSYSLDYIKNELKMNPLTFIYDWGMVTDLARRNQARVCGKLGIEQIVVSADIKKKRENIRKNLETWLKKPDLGMVPILMAGDKQFYHYFHKIREQNNIKLFIFCGGYEGEESTGLFKYGFCGIDINTKQTLNRVTGIPKKYKLKLILYYIKQYITNPGYINTSILDTLFAYYSTYILPDDYLYLFHYIEWDEEKVVSTILKKFNWEKETDTTATWRIDDGTAAFYNYIYMTMAGFTEFDTFRSHQIREGKLTRNEALKLVKEENKPRYKSIEWYAQAVNFDVNKAINAINSAKKLYNLKNS